mmetsp:Transcript_36163/g.104046  ORF Transcript_36163/g.104046 Transcript_36163/m.104046 type:complete len:200 (+) Transcript_36163:540-1139(+)
MWRSLPRMTGLEASPSTESTSSAVNAPPTTSMAPKAESFALRPCWANAVTSLSSHVPAAFQAEPAVLAAGSTAADAASAAIGVGAKSFFGSAVGFHSRCLYHVKLSSLSTTVSSSCRFLCSAFAVSVAEGGLAAGGGDFFSSGFLQQRLWNFQSSFWHCAEQYAATLHTPHRKGLAMSLWQLWQCGVTSAAFAATDVAA